MCDVINILVLEDLKDDYLLIERKIKISKFNYKCNWANSAEQFKEMLGSNKWDLILSDNSLPGINAAMALSMTRSSDSDVPFIIVSATINEELAVEAMKAGANDFIMKDNLSRLVPAIEREVKEAANRRKQRKVEEELQTFLYRSSHDLKGPIASLAGLVSVFKHCNTVEGFEENLPHFERSVYRLQLAVEHLLDIYRMKENERDTEDVDIERHIQTALASLKHMPGFKNTEFTIKIGGKRAFWCDSDLVQLVLRNLLENAIKYRQRGDAKNKVEISSYYTKESLNILVKDNGMGFDKLTANKAFDMFYRGSDYSDGNGLGLYICSCAIEKMNGDIKLYSKKGAGTIVKVKIPQNKKQNEWGWSGMDEMLGYLG